MSTIEIIAVAVALAMDAFTVSIAAGVTLRRVSGRQTFRLSWHFGLFQSLMPIVGWGAGLTVQELISAVDHWVAFGLLVFIGGRMIAGAMSDGERWMTVERLKAILSEIEDEDLLIPNRVGNLSVVRNDKYIGFIDFNGGKLDLVEEDDDE